MAELLGAAKRDDDGVSERAGWLERDNDRLFVFEHLPERPRAGLVVCSPVGAEFDVNYRREVLLGRELARRGVGVLRFHYRCTGNSTGERQALTHASMLADAVTAVRHWSEMVGSEVAVLGTRTSSFVAVGAATETGSPGLVLWQPPVTGRRYLRELGRLRQMNKLVQQAGRDETDRSSISDELDENGWFEVAGYDIHRALHDDITELDLDGSGLSDTTSVLVVQFGPGDVGSVLADRLGEWRESLRSCEITTIEHGEDWWFANDLETEEDRPVTAAALEATGDWLLRIAGQAEAVSR